VIVHSNQSTNLIPEPFSFWLFEVRKNKNLQEHLKKGYYGSWFCCDAV
jgi:hypothetical protein